MKRPAVLGSQIRTVRRLVLMSRMRTAETIVIGANPPVNTAVPVISGGTPPINVGAVLTSSNGTWTNTPTSYTYQWLRDGTFIPSATANSYTVAAADMNHTLACRVTATNADGSASATSASTATVVDTSPVNTVAPVATVNYLGMYPDGVMTTTNGTWTNSPTSYTYQWQSAGVNIAGATNNTYTLQVGDIGSMITCIVTAINAVGSGAYPTAQQRCLWSPKAHLGVYTMTHWLDPSDEANVTEVGGFVTQVTDKSGNGAHAIQPTAAVQPTRGTPTGWLRKVVQFPGTTLGYWMYGTASFVGTHSVRLLAQQLFTDSETVANGRFMVACTATGNDADVNGSMNLNRSSSTDVARYNTGGTNQSVPGNGNQLPSVIKTRLDGTNKYVARDGGTEASIASGYNMNATGYGLNCGKNAGTAPGAYNGTRMHWNMGELISYGQDLPQAELDKLDGYLAWRWAAQMVTNLPSGHTYKSAAP